MARIHRMVGLGKAASVIGVAADFRPISVTRGPATVARPQVEARSEHGRNREVEFAGGELIVQPMPLDRQEMQVQAGARSAIGNRAGRRSSDADRSSQSASAFDCAGIEAAWKFEGAGDIG